MQKCKTVSVDASAGLRLWTSDGVAVAHKVMTAEECVDLARQLLVAAKELDSR